jgi:hypothetical protein
MGIETVPSPKSSTNFLDASRAQILDSFLLLFLSYPTPKLLLMPLRQTWSHWIAASPWRWPHWEKIPFLPHHHLSLFALLGWVSRYGLLGLLRVRPLVTTPIKGLALPVQEAGVGGERCHSAAWPAVTALTRQSPVWGGDRQGRGRCGDGKQPLTRGSQELFA